MAELLIRAKTNGPDPKRDWQRGHVVFVAEDGHTWGRLEGPPEFYVVRVKGTRDEWWQKLRNEEQIGVDAAGEPVFSDRPPKILDVDVAAPPNRAAVRVPKLRRLMLRQRMSQRLDQGEKLRIHRKGMSVRRVF